MDLALFILVFGWFLTCIWLTILLGKSIARRLENWSHQQNLKIIVDFRAKFPDKCPICSLHRYGVNHGHISPSKVVEPHSCIEHHEHPQ